MWKKRLMQHAPLPHRSEARALGEVDPDEFE
jgi:hypothetical protein